MQVTTRSAGSLPPITELGVSSTSPGLNATGAAWKRKCTVTGLVPALLLAKPRRMSRFLALRNRAGVGSEEGGVASSPFVSVTATARDSLPISASSLLVKEACSGPRQPSTRVAVSRPAVPDAPTCDTVAGGDIVAVSL